MFKNIEHRREVLTNELVKELQRRNHFDYQLNDDELNSIVNQMWPVIGALLAEQDHAIDHITECNSCEDCTRLAKSVFFGLNHDMALELVLEDIEVSDD